MSNPKEKKNTESKKPAVEKKNVTKVGDIAKFKRQATKNAPKKKA